MKAVRKLGVLLSLGAISTGAFASPLEQTYLATCNKDPGVPVPITVVSPTVGAEYHGASVHLEFVVDAEGKTSGFSIKSAPDDVLASAVVKAVKQWRFQPAEVDGKPVSRRVALPVKIVDSAGSADRYAGTE
jgi:TonB family protein